MRTIHHRRGFTLIELLVTMALIILLLSLAIAVSSSATLDSYKINGAGDRLSQSLITAKARAARDQAPRGIRLIAGTDNYLRELVYIEQPDPFLPDQSLAYQGTANPQTIPVGPYVPYRSQLAVKYNENPAAPPYPVPPGSTNLNYVKPLAANCSVYLLLTPADYARFTAMFVSGQNYVASSPDMSAAFAFTSYSGGSLTYGSAINPGNLTVLQLNVTNIINPDLGAGQTPQVATSATNTTTSPAFSSTTTPYMATFQTTLFGIYPPPRPLAGEPSIILSKNAAVDPLASSPSLTPGQNVDILFAPAGNVMNSSIAVMAFLIRDTFKSNPQSTPPGGNWLIDVNGLANYRAAGEMVLVGVFTRTGAVATKPVNEPLTTTTDPYLFVKDAISSGL